MHDLIVITGQTATGKTKLALDYSFRLDGELVNADSRQVYKYLDIITGKDKGELEKSKIKVHLLDVATPNQSFSSYHFVSLAEPVIQDIWKRKKTPIIVGGSYLYIKHLLYGQDIKVPPDPNLRKLLEKLSLKKLQKKLSSLNKSVRVIMNNSDWNNPRRLIRKIEILTAQKKLNKGSTSEVGRSHSSEVKFGKVKMIGLKHKSRDSLVNAITERVEKRLEQGAIDEVRKVIAMGYKENDPGLQTIGYNQIIQFLKGALSKEKAIEQWINKEVQYAKRQYTFMKTDEKIKWEEVSLS